VSALPPARSPGNGLTPINRNIWTNDGKVKEFSGTYPEAARQLVAGYDELLIMQQIDCYRHGLRRASGVGHLVESIRQSYELRYPDDDAQAFVALLEMFSPAELRHAAGLARRLGLRGSGQPQSWPVEFRAVVRFVLSQGLDPERC